MSTEHDVDRICATLGEAGAPLLSREDMQRLCKGRMAELLDFISGSLVGREQAALARNTIQMHRAQARLGAVTSEEDPDPLHTAVQRAEARLKSTRGALEASEGQMKKQMRLVTELEDEKNNEQEKLNDKQLTALLLSVLERKEKIRRDRFKEILRLLDQLREKTAEVESVKTEAEIPLPKTTSIPKSIATGYTCDVLAALQAHGLRLSRLSSVAADTALPDRTKDAESRLLDAIASSMGLSTDDPAVVATYNKCLSAARERARRKVQYHSPLPDDEPADDIQAISRRVVERERELQSLADRAAALTLASARALQADVVFGRETAPQLKDSLRTEVAASQGYLDTLRLSIVNRPKSTDSDRGVQGKSLSRGRSFARTLSDIEHNVANTRETESFLETADALIVPSPKATDSHAAMADKYRREEAEFSEQLQKLLERKGSKAPAGRVLIEDIERLTAEVAIVAGTHL